MPTACMHVLGKLPAKVSRKKQRVSSLWFSSTVEATQLPRCPVPVAHLMTIMHRLPETAVHISKCGAAVHHCVHRMHAAICRSVFTGANRCLQLMHQSCTSSGTEALQTMSGPAISGVSTKGHSPLCPSVFQRCVRWIAALRSPPGADYCRPSSLQLADMSRSCLLSFAGTKAHVNLLQGY